MRTVGQSLWDDIKILGLRLGHLISNSEPGGTAPFFFLTPALPCWRHDFFKPRSNYSEQNLKLRGSGTIKKYETVCKQWSFIWYVDKPCIQWVGQEWDIDIKIWGKILGHWYRKNHGVPLSPYWLLKRTQTQSHTDKIPQEFINRPRLQIRLLSGNATIFR